MKKKVTFADLAEYTGFSKTTISRFFNDPDSLTPENQKIIGKAIRELGYKENKLAKVLANGNSEFIGVIMPTLYMHYHAELLMHIISAGEKYGYKFLVFCSDEDYEREKKYLKELMAYKVEGLIVTSHITPSRELAQLGIPVVTIEREDRHVSSVNADNYNGGYAATKHLAETGCEVLIHINGELKETSPAYGRIRGFRKAAEEYGIPTKEYLVWLGNEFEKMKPGLEKIFHDIDTSYAGKKKGIFVSNDTTARVLLNLILQKYRGLDSYRLIGFDDSPVSRDAIIPLSTIHQDISVMADTAIGMLVDQMDQRKKHRQAVSAEPVHRIIETELIIRDTTE